MPRARLIAIALCLGCGASAPPAQISIEPATDVAVTEDDWRASCAVPSFERLESQRQLAVREARAAGEPSRLELLLAWRPRTASSAPAPITDDGVRAVAIGVMRRSLSYCGEGDAIALTDGLVRYQTIAAIAPAGQNAEHLRLAEYFRGWAEARGLVFRVSGEHDAWELELPGATDARALSLVFHADVVPVNDPPVVIAGDAIPAGWTVPAFTTTLRDGRLYGRGTEDDKGPIAAGMIAMALLADAGIAPTAGSLVLAIGTAEEDSWDGMRRYAASAPRARHVVSVDSNFPAVVAESGFVAWGVRSAIAPAERSRRPPHEVMDAVSATGGLFLTQVPDRAELVLRPRHVREGIGRRGPFSSLGELRGFVQWAIDAEVAARGDEAFRAELETIEIDGAPALRIVAHGRSAHSSTAEEGRNALWLLSGIVWRLTHPREFYPWHTAEAVPPFLAQGTILETLEMVHALFDGDHHGERLGLRYADDLMGELLVAPTLLRTEGGEVTLEVNMRRPRGLSGDEFRARLEVALARVRSSGSASARAIEEIYVGEPHVAELEGDLVPTLMAIWRVHTGEQGAQPLSIRGGTYARLFPGAVDFGPSLPGRPYTGHGADEHIELEALRATTLMLFEATLRLTGTAD